jgi:hypothetical protein
MANFFITLIISIFFTQNIYSQNNPKYLPNLPENATYELIGENELHVSNYKTEVYFVKINSNTTLTYLSTQGLPDCLVGENKFEGLDIYKKMKSGGYERIIHIRKVGEIFKVFYVNYENENGNIMLTTKISDGNNKSSTSLIAYSFYFNSL